MNLQQTVLQMICKSSQNQSQSSESQNKSKGDDLIK